MNNQVHFVVGTGRSGTTLCQQLLSKHPQLCVLNNETHFIATLARKLRKQPFDLEKSCLMMEQHWVSDGSFRWVDSHLKQKKGANYTNYRGGFGSWCRELCVNDLKSFIEAFFTFCYGTKRRIFIEKTPLNGLYMTDLKAIWPDAKFIHIVRDGRFSAVSMSKHKGFIRLINGGFLEKFQDYSYQGIQIGFPTEGVTYEQCAIFTSKLLTKIWEQSERLDRQDYLEIKYEDLVLDTRKTLIQIIKFLGCAVDELWLLETSSTPDKGLIEKQKRQLNDKQWDSLTELIRPSLERLGYPLEKAALTHHV